MAGEVENNNMKGTGLLAGKFQNILAWMVFLVSTGGIMIAAYWSAGTLGEGSAENRRQVFSTLVPLFSTWVGTILAFYFSRENFAAAAATYDRVVDKLTPEQRLQQTSVRQVMKTKGAIKTIDLVNGVTEDTVLISELQDLVSKGFSRIPIFGAGDTAKYVIHESTLNKFIVEVLKNDQAVDVAKLTLRNLLDHTSGDQKIAATVSLIVAVKTDATLADARAEMLAKKGSQDVFVTKNGRLDEAVEGWLTNVDITRDI